MSSRKHRNTPRARHQQNVQSLQVPQPFVYPPQNNVVFDAWMESRTQTADGVRSPPGSPRKFTVRNAKLAVLVVRQCMADFMRLLWGIHPFRTGLLVLLNTLRGTLPAFRFYSQALLLDEIQRFLMSGTIDAPRFIWLFATEGARMLGESLFDAFANHNDNLVQQSVRFHIEYLQMQTRLRLDIPALCDPSIRDLLHESDLFVQSFSGMGGFGILSPLDFIHALTTVSEIISQLFILYTIYIAHRFSYTHILAIISAFLPMLFSYIGNFIFRLQPDFYYPQFTQFDSRAARMAQRHEQMRFLAHNDHYKAEITLFGLGDWILETWASARRALLGIESIDAAGYTSPVRSFLHSSALEMFGILQNVPFALQVASGSMGSATLTRSAAQNLVASLTTFANSLMASFNSIFLLAAFQSAIQLQPKMKPRDEEKVEYKTRRNAAGKRGMKIETRNLSFSYPGLPHHTLRNINLVVKPNEVVAIVGPNGGGKTTLMHVLSRLYSFDSGEFLINDVDVRKYDPVDLHAHSSAVFQSFSKFVNASIRENTGVGQVSTLSPSSSTTSSDNAIRTALRMGGAVNLVDSLPDGLETRLDSGGYGVYTNPPPPPGIHQHQMVDEKPPPYRRTPARGEIWGVGGPQVDDYGRATLSGGEWQRIAISRAFMRADTADLFLVDEGNSQLDSKAQNDFFRELVAREDRGTIIFVTHRLDAVKWADKVALVEGGTITEFGRPEELLAKEGSEWGKLWRGFEDK